MLGPGNPRGIGKAQLGAAGFEQPDDAIRIILLRFAETRPPGAKLIGIFNRPRHVSCSSRAGLVVSCGASFPSHGALSGRPALLSMPCAAARRLGNALEQTLRLASPRCPPG